MEVSRVAGQMLRPIVLYSFLLARPSLCPIYGPNLQCGLRSCLWATVAIAYCQIVPNICSLAQISECGSDQVVDSIGSVCDDISDSDCSDSESCASGQQQPTSIDVSVVDPVDDRKSPTGQRIAKDTGCCLYSAITALVVMVVSCQTELDNSLSIYIYF